MLFGLLLVVLGLGLALGLRLALGACIKFDLHYPRTHKDTRGFTRIHEDSRGFTRTQEDIRRRTRERREGKQLPFIFGLRDFMGLSIFLPWNENLLQSIKKRLEIIIIA